MVHHRLDGTLVCKLPDGRTRKAAIDLQHSLVGSHAAGSGLACNTADQHAHEQLGFPLHDQHANQLARQVSLGGSQDILLQRQHRATAGAVRKAIEGTGRVP